MKIAEQALKSDWAAVVTGVEGPYVAAIRYMDLGTANRRNMTFADWRNEARRDLAEIGEVVSGMCSCTEFIAAARAM